MYLCSVGIAFGHWPGTVKEKKKHHLRLWAVLCFMCRPSVCQSVSCLHTWFYSHILDVANQHQTLREKEPRPLPLAGLPHMFFSWVCIWQVCNLKHCFKASCFVISSHFDPYLTGWNCSIVPCQFVVLVILDQHWFHKVRNVFLFSIYVVGVSIMLPFNLELDCSLFSFVTVPHLISLWTVLCCCFFIPNVDVAVFQKFSLFFVLGPA